MLPQEDGHFVRENLKNKKRECKEAEEYTNKFDVLTNTTSAA